MTAFDVQRIIQTDLATGENRSMLDIAKCLIQPCLVDCYDHTEVDPPDKLWLVFQEVRIGNSGYSIVFDESEHAFGLAIRGKSGKQKCIALYETFLQALNAM